MKVIVKSFMVNFVLVRCLFRFSGTFAALAGLYLEARLLVIGGECTQHDSYKSTTIWSFAQVKIANHVSIFLVCSIGFEEETQWEYRLNGGPRDLDLMSSLIHGP